MNQPFPQVADVGAVIPSMDARKDALKTLGVGALLVAVSLGIVAAAAVMGWKSSMISGTALLLGWTYLGFGIGEFVFARRFRVVSMLLAVIFGVAGMAFTFAAIHWLGFSLSKSPAMGGF